MDLNFLMDYLLCFLFMLLDMLYSGSMNTVLRNGILHTSEVMPLPKIYINTWSNYILLCFEIDACMHGCYIWYIIISEAMAFPKINNNLIEVH